MTATADQATVRSMFVFGLIDGLNGAVGLIVSLSLSNAAPALIITALLARAGSSSVSMGGAEFTADEDTRSTWLRSLRVVAMVSGYLLSAVGSGLGFFFSQTAGRIVVVPFSIACLVVITWVRAQKHPLWQAAILTLGIFGAAVTVGILASLIAP